jgi:uncharacterized OB-fold protein
MEPSANPNPKAIVISNKSLRAAKCDKCGAKMYPPRLLKPHLHRHERRDQWFTTELKKLQDTFARMRDLS